MVSLIWKIVFFLQSDISTFTNRCGRGAHLITELKELDSIQKKTK